MVIASVNQIPLIPLEFKALGNVFIRLHSAGLAKRGGMKRRRGGASAIEDAIDLFSEDGISLTADEAEHVLEFLQGLAKVVVNECLKESGDRPHSNNSSENSRYR